MSRSTAELCDPQWEHAVRVPVTRPSREPQQFAILTTYAPWSARQSQARVSELQAFVARMGSGVVVLITAVIAVPLFRDKQTSRAQAPALRTSPRGSAEAAQETP